MISLCFFPVFISAVLANTITCHNESQCTTNISSTAVDTVNGYGYKSLFQSPSSATKFRYCYGALSCKETPFIDTYSLWCYGTSSCSNSGFIEAAWYIIGDGANSLTNTNISTKGPGIYCTADKSCAHSTISSTHSTTVSLKQIFSAKGALSVFATTINVLSGIFTAYFYGYYAGYQATINCQAGSTCNIHCAHNGCGGLSLICDGNAQCNIINEGVYPLSPNTNIELNTEEILFWNSTQITATNEDECSKQITDKTFDNYKELYIAKYLIYTTNVGPICCRARTACSYSSISYDSNGASVVCSGYRSCYHTDIISNSYDLMVECSAASACYGGSFTGNGGTAYCYGEYACYGAAITKISHIYCTGFNSCTRANIISSGMNITVYLTGHYSGNLASITCNENDHCTILCTAYQACREISLCCQGTCFVECNQDTYCPELVCGTYTNPTPKPTTNPIQHPIPNPTAFPIFNPTAMQTPIPTAMPISNPTAMPTPIPTVISIPNTTANPTKTTLKSAKTTANPTVNPTFNLSTKQRANAETITIIAMAVSVFLGAFFGTICVFLYMNKRRNAKPSNAVEFEGVEGEDSMEMITKNEEANNNTLDTLPPFMTPQNEEKVNLNEQKMSTSIQMISYQ